MALLLSKQTTTDEMDNVFSNTVNGNVSLIDTYNTSAWLCTVLLTYPLQKPVYIYFKFMDTIYAFVLFINACLIKWGIFHNSIKEW